MLLLKPFSNKIISHNYQKRNKIFILLRSFLSVVMVVVFLFSSIVLTVSADSYGNSFINFNEYASYQTSSDGSQVYVESDLPLDSALVYYEDVPYTQDSNGVFRFTTTAGIRYFRFNPLGGEYLRYFPDVGTQVYGASFIDLTYIPSKTTLTFGCTLETFAGGMTDIFVKSDIHYIFVDSSGKVVAPFYDSYDFTWYFDYDRSVFVLDLVYTLDLSSISLPDNVAGIFVSYWMMDDFIDTSTCTVKYHHFKMQFPYSVILQEAIHNQKVEQSLLEIDKAIDRQNQLLEDQNGKLDGIQDSMNDQNDKLDQLPGEIGDEMQNVIDQEKQEAQGEGNKFVDQILDALPDPSQGVLAALGELTDAVSYTGTEAIIPIPKIVIPAIDGLFDEIVLYEGSEFDIGEHLYFIPDKLLTVVRSLFTIAIVLFCVYELKGIITYCFTLRESKGG